jgi:hypothetical protein
MKSIIKNNNLIFITSIIIIFIVTIIIFYTINYLLKKYNRKKEHFNNNNSSNSICTLYAYYEKNDLYKDNFTYFLNNGILDNVDYYIIINGECTINIPERSNITLFKRENKGYDFGAYSYAIKNIKREYNYYFFINTSVCGPYLKDSNKPWTSYFLELFNDDVKVVGTSINILTSNTFSSKYDLTNFYNKNPPYSHVQSMFFCIDNEYYQHLKNINFFDEDTMNNENNIKYIIVTKEIGLSQIALKEGWNINSILSKYKNLDYRVINEDINNTSRNGDPYYPKSYFGEDIDKYEVIFYKNNR